MIPSISLFLIFHSWLNTFSLPFSPLISPFFISIFSSWLHFFQCFFFPLSPSLLISTFLSPSFSCSQRDVQPSPGKLANKQRSCGTRWISLALYWPYGGTVIRENPRNRRETDDIAGHPTLGYSMWQKSLFQKFFRNLCGVEKAAIKHIKKNTYIKKIVIFSSGLQSGEAI